MGSTHPTRTTDEMAAEFATHWNELVGFILNRRRRSSIYRGLAAELSPAKLQALLILAGGDVRMGDLAARLGLAESSVTRLVEGLETLELVARRMPATDRRSVTVGLRPRGRRVVEQVHQGRQEFLGDVLHTLDPLEQEEVVRLFGKVAQALKREEANGRHPHQRAARQ
jgi:DNA-binding MarR family transcriptional regulator